MTELLAAAPHLVGMYDVIVVGARVAGAATAMLLARGGLDVLAVDRASFPSDTLSTHQVQVAGVARLPAGGVLGRLVAAGTPATRRVRFDPGPVVLEGSLPAFEGVDAIYSPRRTVLDAILVDAARAAGAEVRERAPVDEFLFDGDRVTGVRAGGVRETARLVVGADGRHSAVAKAVGARAYHVKPPLTVGYYAYWAGVPLEGGEIYARPEARRLIGAWPTNDGLTLTFVAAPTDEFAAFKADAAGSLLGSSTTPATSASACAPASAPAGCAAAATSRTASMSPRPGLGTRWRCQLGDGPVHRPGDRRRVPRRRAARRRDRERPA